MPFTIVRQDITKMTVDAVVNAANTALQMGGGVCGAIFKAAGERELQAACDKLAPIQTGEAVVTPAFGLPAKIIIHTAGPVYRGGQNGEEALLRACYRNSLQQAVATQCESIAFPLISSGIYGYPKEEALRVAVTEIQEFLGEQDLDVYLVVFDKAAFAISEQLLGEVASYIDEHYVEIRMRKRRELQYSEKEVLTDTDLTHLNRPRASISSSAFTPIDERIKRLDESFSKTLLKLIDAKGLTDVTVYKRANLDRKLFSKIRTGKGYMPSKRTVLALAIALELSIQETAVLLERAGYALSHSQMFDVIVEYFIISRKYDIFEINAVLFKYDQPLLGV